jgi:hypothetical protein
MTKNIQLKKIKGRTHGILWDSIFGLDKSDDYVIDRVVMTTQKGESLDINDYSIFSYQNLKTIAGKKGKILTMFFDPDNSHTCKVTISKIMEWKDGFEANLEFISECGARLNIFATDYIKNKQAYLEQGEKNIEITALALGDVEHWDYKKNSDGELKFAKEFCSVFPLEDENEIYESVFHVLDIEEVHFCDNDFIKAEIKVVEDENPVIFTLYVNKNDIKDELKIGGTYYCMFILSGKIKHN